MTEREILIEAIEKLGEVNKLINALHLVPCSTWAWGYVVPQQMVLTLKEELESKLFRMEEEDEN